MTKTTDLTKVQEVYLARRAIKDCMADLPSGTGFRGTLGQALSLGVQPSEKVSQDLIDGYWLAVEDLEKARIVMEEASAFRYLLDELIEKYPETPRSQLQKSARSLVADPATRQKAAKASGLWDVLDAAASD